MGVLCATGLALVFAVGACGAGETQASLPQTPAPELGLLRIGESSDQVVVVGGKEESLRWFRTRVFSRGERVVSTGRMLELRRVITELTRIAALQRTPDDSEEDQPAYHWFVREAGGLHAGFIDGGALDEVTSRLVVDAFVATAFDPIPALDLQGRCIIAQPYAEAMGLGTEERKDVAGFLARRAIPVLDVSDDTNEWARATRYPRFAWPFTGSVGGPGNDIDTVIRRQSEHFRVLVLHCAQAPGEAPGEAHKDG
jgi:hypothetical protein